MQVDHENFAALEARVQAHEPAGMGELERARRIAACRRGAVGKRWRRPAAAFAGLWAPLLLAGRALADSSQPGAIQGPSFIWLYVGVWLLALVLMVVLQTMVARRQPAVAHNETDPGSYELAYLRGGDLRVFTTALLRLSEAGHIVIGKVGRSRFGRMKPEHAQAAMSLGAPLPPGASAIDQAIVNALARRSLSGPKSISLPINDLERRLRNANLLLRPDTVLRLALIAAVVTAPVLGLGAVYIYDGDFDHRTIVFLVFSLPFIVVYSCIITAVCAKLRPATAVRLVRQAKTANPRAKTALGKQTDPVLAFAIWGLVAVGAEDYVNFRHVVIVYDIDSFDTGF